MSSLPHLPNSIVVERSGSDGAIATLWLNRPDKRNSMTLEMWQGVADVCADLANDDTVRALVLRGRGDHFCAGADIASLRGPDAAAFRDANRNADDALAAFSKPTIAFINGSCVGGGAELAIACDIRIADSTSMFGITPARLGIIYPTFALERAVRLLGASAAKHLLYTAELIDGERALRVGLIDELHEPAPAVARLEALSEVLCQRSMLTQMASKAMVDEIAATGRVDSVTASWWQAELDASDDLGEGIAAFAEKRRPNFRWRPASPR